MPGFASHLIGKKRMSNAILSDCRQSPDLAGRAFLLSERCIVTLILIALVYFIIWRTFCVKDAEHLKGKSLTQKVTPDFFVVKSNKNYCVLPPWKPLF